MKVGFSNYMQLTKPRLTLMALVTALSGFYLGSSGQFHFLPMFQLMIGACLIGGGANALNQYIEKDYDAKMVRTKERPLPSLRIKKNHALLFGLCLALGGVIYLYFLANPLSSGLALAMLFCYLLLYTPLKQKTWLNTFIGAVSGALPTLIGWSAGSGQLPNLNAWVFFLILFFWQMPHFFAIAWVYREDYKAGGFRMLSIEDRAGQRTCVQIALFSVLLFAASLLPTFVGIAGLLYFSAALFTGLLFLTFALYASTHKMKHSKELVSVSIFYLAVLNIFLWFDKI